MAGPTTGMPADKEWNKKSIPTDQHHHHYHKVRRTNKRVCDAFCCCASSSSYSRRRKLKWQIPIRMFLPVAIVLQFLLISPPWYDGSTNTTSGINSSSSISTTTTHISSSVAAAAAPQKKNKNRNRRIILPLIREDTYTAAAPAKNGTITSIYPPTSTSPQQQQALSSSTSTWCTSTSHIKLLIPILSHNDDNDDDDDESSFMILLETYDKYGNLKTMGGDEFYVTYYTTMEDSKDGKDDNTNNNYYSSIRPTAVATVEDLNNGQYKLQFHSIIPLIQQPIKHNRRTTTTTKNHHQQPPQQQQHGTITTTTNSSIAGGMLRVILQYSCGIGSLHPPSKVHWTTAGQLNRQFRTLQPLSLSDIIPTPIPSTTASATEQQQRDVIIPQPPASLLFSSFTRPVIQQQQQQHPKSNLSQYDMVFIYGDSLMNQLDSKTKHHVIRHATKKVGAKLQLTTLEHWKTYIVKENKIYHDQLVDTTRTGGNGTDGTAGRYGPHSNKSVAILIGSSTWDLLTDDKLPTGMNNNKEKEEKEEEEIMENIVLDHRHHHHHHHYNSQNSTTGVYNGHKSFWDDHLVACRKLITFLRSTYPHITILWKSPTSIQIHLLKMKTIKRCQYMSTSRVYQLYTLQKQ